MTGGGWSLYAAKINDLQQDSIAALVRRCRAAHFVNVQVRINGKWETYEADWIKHLTREHEAPVEGKARDHIEPPPNQPPQGESP
jgi:hypothetical protein